MHNSLETLGEASDLAVDIRSLLGIGIALYETVRGYETNASQPCPSGII